jgi:hypothetical protein
MNSDLSVLWPLDYFKGFFGTYFVAAETANAAAVIDDHPAFGPAYRLGSADAGTVAAANAQ